MTSLIKPEQKKQSKESPLNQEAFLIYFNQGNERSMVNVRKELGKKGIKISLRGIEKWSGKYKWVERVQAMDQEVMEKAEELAIKNATINKSAILSAVKNTMIVYNRGIISGNIIPSASDFKKMWEVMRIELGKNVGDGQTQEIPTINIAIVNNEKVIKIIKEAQDRFREVLEAEIEND